MSMFDKSSVCPRANKGLAPISGAAEICFCITHNVMAPQTQQSCRLGAAGL